MQNITLRTATPSDLPTLKQFEQGIIAAERPYSTLIKPDPVHYYDFDDLLNNPLVDCIVAELNHTIIACGYARIEPARHFYKVTNQAYLGMMYVLPEHRGKGINAMIIDELKNRVAKKGITELVLDVFTDNLSAIKAYEKVGFRQYMVEMRLSTTD